MLFSESFIIRFPHYVSFHFIPHSFTTLILFFPLVPSISPLSLPFPLTLSPRLSEVPLRLVSDRGRDKGAALEGELRP